MEQSRRDFLKLGGAAAIVATTAGLVGCGSKASAEGKEGSVLGVTALNWAEETDVVIVGTGISGMSAGILPIKAGKKVTYIEKLPTYGGESIISCGMMFFYGTDFQLNNGLKMTIDDAWNKVSLPYYEKMQKLPADYYIDWQKDVAYSRTEWHNVVTNEFGATWQKPSLAGGLFDSIVLPEGGIGNPKSVLGPLYNGLKKLGAEFRFDTRATNLIVDEAGAVIGIRCRDEASGANIDIKASRVVLASGGYSCNQELMAKYMPKFSNIGNLTVHSMGEGQLMGAAAGAELTGMDTYSYLMGDIPQSTTWGYFAPCVLVLPNGKRFINEGQSHDSAGACLEQGFDQWWVLFDQQAIGCEQIAESVKGNIAGSPDRYATANSIEELATLMKVPAKTLAETMANYNAMATAGADTEFKKTRFLKPLSAPFHALKLNTRRYKTFGGFNVSVKNEVLNADGKAIPGLYACGTTVPWCQSDLSANTGNSYACGRAVAESLTEA